MVKEITKEKTKKTPENKHTKQNETSNFILNQYIPILESYYLLENHLFNPFLY